MLSVFIEKKNKIENERHPPRPNQNILLEHFKMPSVSEQLVFRGIYRFRNIFLKIKRKK